LRGSGGEDEWGVLRPAIAGSGFRVISLMKVGKNPRNVKKPMDTRNEWAPGP